MLARVAMGGLGEPTLKSNSKINTYWSAEAAEGGGVVVTIVVIVVVAKLESKRE